MKVDNGNTVWIAAFFPIEGMDIRHLEVARLVCGKGGVKGRHFTCVLITGCLSGSLFCRKVKVSCKISKVPENFNTSNNIRDKRQLYITEIFQPTIFSTPRSLGELAFPERPILLDGARVALYPISPTLKIVVQYEDNGNRSAECSKILLNTTLLRMKMHLPSQPCSLEQSHF